ncbi:MAG TPA: RNA polymerase sigma factor region1.1 domain-containing protein, partial [Candidatus Colwellbacteria bacterium]|nr:RNA polymerase sigma factor region1.1 domain-containing protein [Candidatus Colwellbacteria bacterium]
MAKNKKKRSARKPVRKTKKPAKASRKIVRPKKSRKPAKPKIAKKVSKKTAKPSVRKKEKPRKFKFDLGVLDELINQGKAKGFVTDLEILKFFPRIETDVPFLEHIYDRIEEAGLRVIDV